MAFTYGFYNSVNHDRKYDAVQMGQIFDGIITDGIYATYLKAMVVKASSNASEVIVQPGRAWFNHTWSYNDADFPVAAPEPEVVLDRIDTLVLDINAEDASRTNSFLWVQGTPTSQIPEPPALIHTVTHNQYPLCDVYRKAGTTQIYAADITNRVGTSDCPFVTGVLESINIDDLLAQWDDEFHTWENATKASFEGWMVNQQSVYTAWWDALKAQMASDVADLEAWIATIHDILDEEVATRLQAEIDEIKTELPSGSHITVTTTDTELYSRTVTITDEANHTVTSQFDATGVAVFKTVPYVGNLTISSTDGTRTATSVVQTPYFARYEFAIAFWNATVNIDGTSELGGATVTITDSSEALVGTVVLNASGLGVFNATYPDTYKFSVTHGGETMSVTLEVSQETTYNVEIHGGFNWQRWVTLGGLDPTDYSSLSDVFTDEEAVRRLMLVHASADYLIDAVSNRLSEIDDFVANDTAMKWIGLCDYVCDGLTAITGVEAKLLASTYWERYLKDHVPVMTSNTAPYGVVSASAEISGYEAYRVFNESTVDMWATGSAGFIQAGSWLKYKFTNPISIKKVRCRFATRASYTIKFQGSNDDFASDVHDLTGIITVPSTSGQVFYVNASDITDDSYYLSIRMYVVTAAPADTIGGVYELQFYGRQLTVSVPVMTSNTAPFGEASASSVNSSSTAAWKAFDGNLTKSNAWNSTTPTNQHITYEFVTPMVLKAFSITPRYGGNGEHTQIKNYKIQGSNDNFVNDTQDLYVGVVEDTLNTVKTYFNVVDNAESYKQYRALGIDSHELCTIGIIELQFYGLDYSEKEFEQGTTKKWLYDHGVELETITISGTGTKGTDAIQLTAANAQAVATIDTTDYSLMRGKAGSHASGTNQLICGSGASNFTASNMPYNNGFDVSSVNGSNAVGVKQTANGIFDATEFWLE